MKIEAGTFPTELTPELAELGVGPTLPEQYGCGAELGCLRLICQSSSAATLACALRVGAGRPVMYPTYGSEEQKRKYRLLPAS
jgi:alkylation response protein AidB-like acyl-CoA dehydrogenase